MTDRPPPEPNTRQTPFWVRCGRWAFALLFVGVPVLGLVGLVGLWARSNQVEETWTAQTSQTDRYDPETRVESSWQCDLKLESTHGLLAFEADWLQTEAKVTNPARELWLVMQQRHRPVGLGRHPFREWQWGHEYYQVEVDQRPPSQIPEETLPTLFEEEPAEVRAQFATKPPPNLLGLVQAGQWLRPLTLAAWRPPTSPDDRNHLTLVAPVWLVMLPWFLPILWWCWCPAGTCWPRLTLRRTLAALVAVALVLALIRRPPPTDQALLALDDYPARVVYQTDPAGRKPTIVVGVDLDLGNGASDSTIRPADAARIRKALTDLVHLRHLGLDRVPGSPSLIAALLPDRLPALESLEVDRCQVRATVLARLADSPRLRRLHLTQTGLTDADLAPLRDLRSLVELRLGEDHVTDAALSHLRGLPRLRQLDLRPQRDHDASVLGPGEPVRLHADALQRLATSLPMLEELIGPDGTVLGPARAAEAATQPEPR